MIRDAVILQQSRDEWGNVRLSQARVKTNLAAASRGIIGGIPVSFGFRDYCHGLTLLFGFSVLENVLRQLREGHFPCPGWMVGPLMTASRGVLPWVDYPLVEAAKDARNDIAHRRTTIPRAETWKYLDALEAELLAWGILPGPVKAKYTLTRGAAK